MNLVQINKNKDFKIIHNFMQSRCQWIKTISILWIKKFWHHKKNSNNLISLKNKISKSITKLKNMIDLFKKQMRRT